MASGHVELLAVLKPDPIRDDDVDDLYVWAPDGRTVRFLVEIRPPREVGGAICHHLGYLDRSWSSNTVVRHMEALETLLARGGRWTEITPDQHRS